MGLILAFLAWIGLIERAEPRPPPPRPVVKAPPAAPAAEARPELPPPPDPLPAAQGCREALSKDWNLRNAPWRVDGRAIWGVAGLADLRAAWGDALILVQGGDFSRAPFRGRRLRNFCFFGSDFTESDWRGAETSGVGFIGADFSGAWLDRSRMRGLLLDTVKLDGATALGADWRGGMLRGGPMGSLKRVRLDGADLRGFRVDCAGGSDTACVSHWGTVSLRGADLRGADVDSLRAEVDWTGARIGGTRVSLHQLTEIGPARRLGPLIVRAGDAEASLTLAEFRALQPFVHSRRDRLPKPVAGTRSGLRPGTANLFVETPVDFDPAFRATALYRRLVPVLAGNPISRMLVTVRPDGRIDAEGDAVGGGDHMCGLAAKGLRLDRATGWYSGPHEPWERDPPEWRSRPMPVLRIRGDRAEAYGDGFGDHGDPRISDYISCGARARFGEMVRLPLTSAAARRWSRLMLR
ncbi:MAG TPA: pentapeptide repeat-containing protein [Allosphingosinicella sp.]|jgi:uncharacterized protein YjbI with pentapeptide repeats|nr:pentapeptide repeat-containing protein [Allosphingosinicella sp.]